MAQTNLKDMIKAGLHFGHAASAWNPKMSPYLRGTRKRVHIFDLRETARGLVAACHMANQVAAQEKRILFVGTKPQARDLIKEVAHSTAGFYVNERWLGGLLTNHEVVLQRLNRMEELEKIDADAAAGSHVYSKKAQAAFKRELKKLHRDLDGVREMRKLPDLMVIVDLNTEHNALKEARICNIPVIALADSNTDPDGVDILIPGNDDSMRGIKYVLDHLREAILDGLSKAVEAEKEREAQENQAATEQKPAASSEASEAVKAETQTQDESEIEV